MDERPLRAAPPAKAKSADAPRPTLRIVPANPSCSTCSLVSFCLPHGQELSSDGHLDEIVTQRLRLRKGEVLVRHGAVFDSLYSVRTGSCKSVVAMAGGGEQTVGFHIAGEMLAAEAIHTGRYQATIVALEDSEFCLMPFHRVEAMLGKDGDYRRSFEEMLSRQIGMERKVMLMLGPLRAEQRLAAFLLDLAERYQARGYSSCEFLLRMTREEIGSLLGLKLETVSRIFSRFHQDGLISVQGREVKLLDRPGLQRILDAEA